MSQQKQASPNNPSLMDSIQSEVSREASPFLEFLVRKSRIIFAVLLALIIAIAIVGGWRFWQSRSISNDREELGRIMIRDASAEKAAALEAWAQGARKELKPAALLALAHTSEEIGDYAKSAEAWNQVAALSDKEFRLVARLGQSAALARQGAGAEALAVLEALLPDAPQESMLLIHGRICDLAEGLSNWDRAIRACDDIINLQGATLDKPSWEQRAAYLRLKKTQSGS